MQQSEKTTYKQRKHNENTTIWRVNKTIHEHETRPKPDSATVGRARKRMTWRKPTVLAHGAFPRHVVEPSARPTKTQHAWVATRPIPFKQKSTSHSGTSLINSHNSDDRWPGFTYTHTQPAIHSGRAQKRKTHTTRPTKKFSSVHAARQLT